MFSGLNDYLWHLSSYNWRKGEKSVSSIKWMQYHEQNAFLHFKYNNSHDIFLFLICNSVKHFVANTSASLLVSYPNLYVPVS